MRLLYSLFAVLLLFSSCRNDNYLRFEDDARLQFGPLPEMMYNTSAQFRDTVKVYTFLTQPEYVERDTVYFDMYLLGNTSNSERAYKLKQTQVKDVENAVAGIHFVPFDDPSVKHLYVLPANQTHVKVPVVVLKDESLKTGDYALRFRIDENDNFKMGDSQLNWRKLLIADVLIVPSSWIIGYWGTYSQTKHRFMMEQTGLVWDEAYFKMVSMDVTLSYYWQSKFRIYLHDYNSNPENIASGKAPLEDEHGKEVKF